jgi:hypothetical protein
MILIKWKVFLRSILKNVREDLNRYVEVNNDSS